MKSQKKDLHDQGRSGQDATQEQRVEYVQNSEQGQGTLWSRINRASVKSKDELYRLYVAKEFEKLVVDQNTDPELAKFINETLQRGPKFANYTQETLNKFVSRIYELREDNSNNTAR